MNAALAVRAAAWEAGEHRSTIVHVHVPMALAILVVQTTVGYRKKHGPAARPSHRRIQRASLPVSFQAFQSALRLEMTSRISAARMVPVLMNSICPSGE